MTQESHSWIFVYRNENEIRIKTDTVVLAALFVIATSCRQPRCPSVGEWVNNKQLWHRVCNGILFSVQNNKLLVHVTLLMNFRATLRQASLKRLHSVIPFIWHKAVAQDFGMMELFHILIVVVITPVLKFIELYTKGKKKLLLLNDKN